MGEFHPEIVDVVYKYRRAKQKFDPNIMFSSVWSVFFTFSVPHNLIETRLQ